MQQATLLVPASPSVSLVSGRPATTSLEVAKFFGKPHDDVLKSVRKIIDVTPENFRLGNFSESSYTNGQGKNQPMFTLFRDGFMLLVMGYTGKKAMQIKITYIEAFNQMETALLQKSTPTRIVCSEKDMKQLEVAVNDWVESGTVNKQQAMKEVRERFGVTRSKSTWTVDLIAPALKWVKSQAAIPRPLPSTTRLFADIEKAEQALQPVEHWTHLAVRHELLREANNSADHLINMHVNTVWYALGLARSSLRAAIALRKLA